MTENLPVGGFKWMKNISKIDEEFIKNYDENGDFGFWIPKELHDLHSYLPFLPEKMEINGDDKLVCALYYKKGYVVRIRNIKQVLKHSLKLKKASKVIAFYQKAWLRPYIEMNTRLRKNAKNDFEKDFCKLMNNVVFGRSVMNVRRHRDIKLATNDKKNM